MQGFSDYHITRLYGIDVIPSESVPNGYKRTEENKIFVSPKNYEYLRLFSAKGVIIAIGLLKEL